MRTQSMSDNKIQQVIDKQLITQLLKHRNFIKSLYEYCDKCEDEISEFLKKNELVIDLQPLSDKWLKFDKNDKSSWPTGRKVLLHLSKPYRFSFGYFHDEDELDHLCEEYRKNYVCTVSYEEDSYVIDLDEITHWREMIEPPEIDNE